MLKDDQRRDLEKDFEAKQLEFKRRYEDFQRDLKRTDAGAHLGHRRAALRHRLRDRRREAGYTMVLESPSGAPLYNDKSIDITDASSRRNANLESAPSEPGRSRRRRRGRRGVATSAELIAETATGARRFRFPLVDRLVEPEPGVRGGRPAPVAANEPYFDGHLPRRRVFPGVLLREALAQLGQWRSARASDVALAGVQRAFPPAGAARRRARARRDGRRRARPCASAARSRWARSPSPRSTSRFDHPRGLRHPSDGGHRAHGRARRRRPASARARRSARTCASAPGAFVGANAWSPAGRRSAGTSGSSVRRVGMPPQDLKYRDEPSRVEIGDDSTVREHASVHAGTTAGGMLTRIGSGCLLMVSAHVGHDSQLGSTSSSAAGAAIGGHVVIEDFAIIGGWSACISSRASASPLRVPRALWCRPTCRRSARSPAIESGSSA